MKKPPYSLKEAIVISLCFQSLVGKPIMNGTPLKITSIIPCPFPPEDEVEFRNGLNNPFISLADALFEYKGAEYNVLILGESTEIEDSLRTTISEYLKLNHGYSISDNLVKSFTSIM